MKIERLKFEDGTEIAKEMHSRNIKRLTTNFDTSVIGYNEVIATIGIKGRRCLTEENEISDERGCLIKRFDGKMYYALDSETLYDIFYMKASGTIVGDIVNLGINKNTHVVKALEQRCVPLSKYCPTLPGIRHYFDELMLSNIGNQFYSIAEDMFMEIFKGIKVGDYKDIQSDIFNIKGNVPKQEFNKMPAKLQMMGAPYVIADINTIVALVNNKKLAIYTMQPTVLHWYTYNKESNTNSIRNYRIDDVPKSQYNKYGLSTHSSRTRDTMWY
jgi:transposase